MRIRSFATVGACAALAFGVAACGGDDNSESAGGGGGTETPEVVGTIDGAGASSQDAAKRAWIAGFQADNPEANISYDPVGSGGGREQFIAGGTQFGGTDAAFEEEELTGAQEQCGGPDNLIQLPVYISPIAIVYNLEGVEELRLSSEVLAGLLLGEIETWNDPQVAELNPGVQLPATRVTPVHRSDESGTTENLAEYATATAPDVWDYEVSGDWPVEGGEAADGTSGVVDAVGSGDGTIGYADASQAGELGVAQIRVGGEFSGPTPEAAAAIVEASERDTESGQASFTYDLERETTEAGTYPIVLVSYDFACTQYDSAEQANLVKAFLSYEISEAGQQQAAQAAGSAPISDTLRQQLQGTVDSISAAG